jgi:hypothetical protein
MIRHENLQRPIGGMDSTTSNLDRMKLSYLTQGTCAQA